MRYVIFMVILLMCLAMNAMSADQTFTTQNIPNPGDGEYVVAPNHAEGFTSISIYQRDPSIPLTGTLTFGSGNYTSVLDLATDRVLILAGTVYSLTMTLDSVDPDARFDIMLR